MARGGGACGAEQRVQGLQSELQRETVECTAAVFELEARVNEEHRFTETVVSAETRAREDNATVLEEALRQGTDEEARKTRVPVEPDHDTLSGR